jgi:uncharacterized phage protein gp47/JayE
MAFQTKDFVSIAASMINWMKAAQQKVTDFSIGSVVRTMLESIAAEIEQLYQQMFIGLKEAIPVAVYNTFSFTKIGAIPATGTIRVTVTSSASSLLIPSGTAFALVTGAQYLSTSDVTIAAGNTYADVPVAAAVPGAAGNLTAGQTFTATPSPSGFVSASNLAPIRNGSDAESDDAQKVRFNAYLQSLSRGTIASYLYALNYLVSLTDAAGNVTEKVASAVVIEPWLTDNTQPVANVNVYIHNGVGSTSAALVAQAIKILTGYTDASGNKIPGYKAAGVNLTLVAATEQAVNVTATLTAVSGYDKPTLVTAAQQAIYGYLIGLPIGAPALFAEIVQLAMDIPGVYNFALTAPAADTTPASSGKIMPGTITIS